MEIIFKQLSSRASIPEFDVNRAYIKCDNWDDYGFKTLFTLIVFDGQGQRHHIGNVKIAFLGQQDGLSSEKILSEFALLPINFYSLGQDVDYYRNLVDKLSRVQAVNILKALGDVAHDPDRLAIAEGESAFKTSLMRIVNRSTLDHQFKRVLLGEAPLTDFDFSYVKLANDRYSGIEVKFQIKPETKPSSNIQILIGRNGVGKTTLLNNMVDALLPDRGTREETGCFTTPSIWSETVLGKDYFAGVVSVSFSAFDPFNPPSDQRDANVGMRYCHVGLKKCLVNNGQNQWGMKNTEELCRDFTESLKLCFALTAKRERWINAVRKLESDFNFAEMDLCQLTDIYDDTSGPRHDFSLKASKLFDRMSSGHAIVLLTVTKLVETVEEKTLVLLDEPESHLHPPLLSAFTRALSDLLVNRNGVAIIATHSPVVLQEVPKSCVSILRRTRLVLNVERPERETFAENVGVLTREVFGLEVSKSGFHDLLASSVAEGKSYEEIEQEYQHQLGFEGKAMLRSMIFTRDSQSGVEE